jgi:hypothetical protein
LIAKRGVSHKVLDETSNFQKPNPPSLVGKGDFKASPRIGERFGEGFIYTLKTTDRFAIQAFNIVKSIIVLNLNEKKDEDLRNNGRLGKGFLYGNLEIEKKTPSLNSLLSKTFRTNYFDCLQERLSYS